MTQNRSARLLLHPLVNRNICVDDATTSVTFDHAVEQILGNGPAQNQDRSNPLQERDGFFPNDEIREQGVLGRNSSRFQHHKPFISPENFMSCFAQKLLDSRQVWTDSCVMQSPETGNLSDFEALGADKSLMLGHQSQSALLNDAKNKITPKPGRINAR